MAQLAALAGALALVVQAAGQEGTVTGSLTLNGATIPFRHVYASAQPGFFDKRTEDVRVLFSDVPLPDAARADPFALIALARAGTAHIVEVVLDRDASPISGGLYAREFDGMVSATGMHVFTKGVFEHGRVAGRMAVAEPHTFSGVTYRYDARFDAPIPRAPTAADVAAELASPPALAGQAYVAAVKARDLAGLRAVLTAAAASAYAGPDAARTLADLAADMPSDSRVVLLVPQTDGTVLVKIEGHQDALVIAYTVRAVRVGAAWKIAPE